MVPMVKPQNLRYVDRDPASQLPLISQEKLAMARNEPTQHVDEVLASLGGERAVA